MELRPWQKEKLDEAIEALKKEKTLLLDVPTGAGKTFFSLLLAKKLKKKCLFLTRTHSEFEVVKKEAERLGLKMSYLLGKNTVCPFASGDVSPEEIDCKECKLRNKIRDDLWTKSPSEVIQISKEASDFCPYYSLRSKINDVDVVAASYMYFFNPVLRSKIICYKDDCIKPENLLVVVDEAHNLIYADEWFMKKISRRTITEAFNELDKVKQKTNNEFTEVREYLERLDSFLKELSTEGGCKELPVYPKPSEKTILKLHSAVKVYINMIKGPIKRSSLRALLEFVSNDGDTFNCNGKLVLVPSNSTELIINSLKIASMHILMSGTLPDLGIKGHKIKVNLQLGKANYIICSDLSSKIRYRLSNAPKYAEVIKDVFNHAQSNVLVYFVSYDFKEMVKEYLKGVPFIEENRDTTHKEILELMKSGKYAVLLVMKGKESEGVEFRDSKTNKNLFSDVILAGYPYPDITDAMVRRHIKKLSDITKRDFDDIANELAMITVKQTIGRAIRSPDDEVNIYLCDSRYSNFFSTKN